MYKLTLHIVIATTCLMTLSCGSLPFFGETAASDSTAVDQNVEPISETPEVTEPDALSESDQAGNSLRDQMRRLEQNQEQMSADIQDVQQRLTRIESDVATIRDYVLNEDPLAGDAITGAPVDTSVDASTFILPDEELADSPSDTSTVIDITDQVLTTDAEEKPQSEQDESETTKVQPQEQTKPTASQNIASVPVKYPEDYKLALQYFAKRRYDDAAQLLRMVTESSPSMIVRTNAHYWMGECQYALGNYNAAIEQFDLFMENKMSPKTDQALLLKAESLLKLGEKKAALELYQFILETYPNSEYIARARKMVQIIDVESEN